MEEKKQLGAEAQLRSIAEKAGVNFRDFHILLQRAYADDVNNKKIVQENMNVDMQLRQSQLMELQYRNETMSNQLLSIRLSKKIKRMNRWNKVKSVFSKNDGKTKQS
jgi:hypothetical protein